MSSLPGEPTKTYTGKDLLEVTKGKDNKWKARCRYCYWKDKYETENNAEYWGRFHIKIVHGS